MSNPRIEALLADFSLKLAAIVKEEARAEVRAALDAALGGPSQPSSAKKSTPASPAKAAKAPAKAPAKAGASKAGAAKSGSKKGQPATFPLVGAPAPKKSDVGAKKSDAKKREDKKRIRRSVADLDRDAGRLVSAVRSAGPKGLLNEEARAQLKMQKTEWQGTLKHALDTKLVRVEGQRRGMRVFVL
jgi:hypothetical protein